MSVFRKYIDNPRLLYCLATAKGLTRWIWTVDSNQGSVYKQDIHCLFDFQCAASIEIQFEQLVHAITNGFA